MTTSNNTAETRDAGFDPEDHEPVPTGRNIITVIGINDYQDWRKLNNAVNDAQGIRKLFVETFGFSEPAPHLFDQAATKDAIIGLVEDQLRHELKPDDTLILFFAGHGHTRVDQVGEREIETGFIVPVEARRDQWGDYLKMNDWLEAISTLPARHIVVILDACHSGFGVGQAMQIFRDAVRYEQDLVGRLSRKIFTSAQRDQLALDGGPLEGHSLFTGTLIDGLNWGKADLDSNGLITGSELGLYVQQQVGQHSTSRQTPDFGAFELDDRGELVIKLGSHSFDGIRARAYIALQGAELANFGELVKQMADQRPDSAETLYLRYRQALYEGDIRQAIELTERLFAMNLPQGVIPLSQHELWELKVQLRYWENVLSIPQTAVPLNVQVLLGQSQASLEATPPQPIGDFSGYESKLGSTFQLKITNPSNLPLYLYAMKFDTSGRFDLITPWRELTIPLTPGEERLSFPFTSAIEPGIFELRLLASAREIIDFVARPDPKSRAALIQNKIPVELLNQIRVQSVYFLTVLPR
jgi:hypothetical protein